MAQILTSYDDLDKEGKRLVHSMRQHGHGSPGYNDAFNKLYGMYYPVVFSVACKEIEDYQLAEDTVHEAFIKFMKTGVKQFRGDSLLSSYLCAITENVARNIRKKRDNVFPEVDITELPGHLPFVQPSPESIADKNILADIFHTAVENLPPKQCRYTTLRLDGYDIAEIAKMTDRAVGTVKTNLFTARENLRRDKELAIAYA